MNNMTILTNSLRSPDERRSDQLTILKRRLPPLKTAGRFFKTTNQTCINSFDPTFDSDADTDGPISDSSFWCRTNSKLVPSVSANSIGVYTLEHVDSLNQTQTSSIIQSPILAINDTSKQIEKEEEKKQEEEQIIVDEEFEEGDLFSRDRAGSFYGANNQDNDEVYEQDNFGPISQCELRKVLDEDYEMFYWKNDNQDEDEEEEEEQQQQDEDDTISKKSSLISCHPTYEMKNDDDRYTITLIDDEDEEEEIEKKKMMTSESFQMTMEQVTQLALRQVESGNNLTRRVPLFIEETGRNPRAAIVDGKLQRVKVSKQDTSNNNNNNNNNNTSNVNVYAEEKESKSIGNWALRSFAQCLGDIEDEHYRFPKKGYLRRRKKKRVPQPSKPAIPKESLVAKNEITNGTVESSSTNAN